MNAETNMGYGAPVINIDIRKYVPEFIFNRYCLSKAKLSYRYVSVCIVSFWYLFEAGYPLEPPVMSSLSMWTLRYCLSKAKLSYRSDTLLRQGISVPRTSVLFCAWYCLSNRRCFRTLHPPFFCAWYCLSNRRCFRILDEDFVFEDHLNQLNDAMPIYILTKRVMCRPFVRVK